MNIDNLKAFFSELFTQLSHEDSWTILFFLLVTFLLGLFFGWLSRWSRISRLKREIRQKDKELIQLRAENGAFKEQLELKEEALHKLQSELEEIQSRTRQLEEENSHLKSDLKNSQRIASSISAENASNLERIDELHKVVADLQYKNDELTALADRGHLNTDDVEHLQDTFELTTNRINALEVKLSRLENENQNLRSELSGSTGKHTTPSDFTDIGLLSIKSRLEQLEKENNRLQKKLDSLQPATSPATTAPAVTEEINIEERSINARTALSSVIGTRIKAASPNEKNDLKKINGIGPFIEKKLNDVGIYTYEQISQFDAEIIQQVTDAIQFFPGRIARDNWVGQAKKLMK